MATKNDEEHVTRPRPGPSPTLERHQSVVSSKIVYIVP